MVEYCRLMKALAPSRMVPPDVLHGSGVPLSRDRTSRASQIAKMTAAMPAMGMIQYGDISHGLGVPPCGRGPAPCAATVAAVGRWACACRGRAASGRIESHIRRRPARGLSGPVSRGPSVTSRRAPPSDGCAVGLSPDPRALVVERARTDRTRGPAPAPRSRRCRRRARGSCRSRGRGRRGSSPAPPRAGRVAPLMARQTATAFVPSTAMATSGRGGDELDEPRKERLVGVDRVVPLGEGRSTCTSLRPTMRRPRCS